MRVCLLGTAAGGGFPQWNCNCAVCRGMRAGTVRARPRSQSCVALSADGRSWFLLNASPDVRMQLESFPPLLPCGGVRDTPIEGILLTNADLDHTLGLFTLREGGRLAVHAAPVVRRALEGGLVLGRVLRCYCRVDWHEPPGEPAPLRGRDGTPSGLRYAAFPIPGKPPRYLGGRVASAPGDSIGYHFEDEATGGRLVFMPDVAALDEVALARMYDCDALLLDGTFWSDDEMRARGAGDASAADMGHLPVGGPDGSLARIIDLPIGRKIYIHINNTNPMLIEDSPEARAVGAAGAEVGRDGMELFL